MYQSLLSNQNVAYQHLTDTIDILADLSLSFCKGSSKNFHSCREEHTNIFLASGRVRGSITKCFSREELNGRGNLASISHKTSDIGNSSLTIFTGDLLEEIAKTDIITDQISLEEFWEEDSSNHRPLNGESLLTFCWARGSRAQSTSKDGSLLSKAFLSSDSLNKSSN